MANELVLPGRYQHMNEVTQLSNGWDSIKLAIREDYRQDPILDKAKRACDAGLNDAAINYIWNLTMYDLYRKIFAYGIDYFSAAINWTGAPLRTLDDLRDVKDYQVISGAYSLGILLPESHFYLQHCRELRNNFSTAHYPIGDIDGIELLNFIKNCIKYVLTFDLPRPGLQIRDLITQMTSEEIKDVDKMMLTIEGQALKIRSAITHSLFSLFIKQDCDKVLKGNIREIAPRIWQTLDDESRSNVAIRYTSLSDVKNDDEANEAKAFLTMVGGIGYIPEDNRTIIFNQVAQKFLDAHFGWDNFYNEPTYAKNLLALGKDVPLMSLQIYVRAIILSFVGNGYGISDAAQVYNTKMLENLSQSGVDMVFRLFEEDLDLIWAMSSLKPSARMKSLMQILKEKTISPEHEIMFKFYEGNTPDVIMKHFDKRYKEKRDKM